MRNPFRRWTHRLTPTELREYRHTTSDERYAADAMPADWPAFTADLFEQPRTVRMSWPEVPGATSYRVTPLPRGTDAPYDVVPIMDAWEHVDAVLGEHPAVTDLRAAVNMVRAHDALDPLEAHTALMLARHEEDIAYGRGQTLAEQYLVDPDAAALEHGTIYLREDREHGARLAALVLAGYTGTPRELVR